MTTILALWLTLVTIQTYILTQRQRKHAGFLVTAQELACLRRAQQREADRWVDL